MFNRKPLPQTDTDVALTKALAELKIMKVTDENYGTALDHVVKLHKMQAEEKPARVSPDTKALVAANITGILMVIGHERLNVITTKAFGLLLKPR